MINWFNDISICPRNHRILPRLPDVLGKDLSSTLEQVNSRKLSTRNWLYFWKGNLSTITLWGNFNIRPHIKHQTKNNGCYWNRITLWFQSQCKFDFEAFVYPYIADIVSYCTGYPMFLEKTCRLHLNKSAHGNCQPGTDFLYFKATYLQEHFGEISTLSKR